ncbi:TIGR04255 family protein [Ruminococcus sp. AF37-20]|uniref:TIGR04255 family protein n=1 Tax=Ruminococcus sp. AF37-20 TaxID=2293178 RepID=UPI000E52FFF0|nr:TIGR04255 family protein [Ruminococcus sp. AF37-20]RGF44212.1 TIGR04255 family protein [Ruminococcus sp. AF37-20]
MKKIKYENCPLIEVVFQVNYPTILAIDSKEPADFQDRIRELYPIYDFQTQEMGQVTVGLGQSQPTFSHSTTSKRFYSFVSTDGKWKVVLSRDMLVLSTVAYSHWEDMLSRVMIPINYFSEIYHPVYYSRVGLRYIDSFEKEKLGLSDSPWKDLLKPHLLGSLSYTTQDYMQVKSASVISELCFDDVIVHSESGLGSVDHRDGNSPVEAFLLNCDYYSYGQFSKDDISKVADKLHTRSHIFFRDSIQDKLHHAMKPIELEGKNE